MISTDDKEKILLKIIEQYPLLESNLRKASKYNNSEYSLYLTKIVFEWGFYENTVLAAMCFEEYMNEKIDKKTVLTFGSDVCSTLEAASTIKLAVDRNENPPENLAESNAVFIVVADVFYHLQFKLSSHIIDVEYCRRLEGRLVPLLKTAKAYKILIELNELLIKMQHPKTSAYIKDCYEKMLMQNKSASENMVKLFRDVCEKNSDIESLVVEKPKINSLFKIIKKGTKEQNLKKLNKKNMFIFDITIIFKNNEEHNSESDLLEAFLKIYEQFMSKDFYIISKIPTKFSDTYFLKVCDHYKNNYRIFIKNKNSFLKYKYGKIAGEERMTLLDGQSFTQKITVYEANDNTPHTLLAGDKLIDFAFSYNDSGYKGIRFNYAIVNGNNYYDPAFPLRQGDKVNLVTYDSPKPQLDWIRICNNPKTLNFLLGYFNKQLKKEE